MVKRRELEKNLLEIASLRTWHREHLIWLTPDGAETDVHYFEAWINLALYYFQQVTSNEMSVEGTVISVDILQDYLQRSKLLRELYEDKTFALRVDAREIMVLWKSMVVYSSIYRVVGDKLSALLRSFNNIIEFGGKIIIELSKQENSNSKVVFKRRQLEKNLLSVGAAQEWSQKKLHFLLYSNKNQLDHYIEAFSKLEEYYKQQITSTDVDDETTVISVDVLQDVVNRIDLLKKLSQNQKLKTNLRIHKMMQDWQLTFSSIYDLIQHYLDSLEQILYKLIEAGVQRIAYLDAQSRRR